jgi:hypothetical protein
MTICAGECLCISAIPQYITGNIMTLGAIALVGKQVLIDELTAMVRTISFSVINES